MTVSVSELEDEIARLRDLDLSGLRARWRSVFRRKAPDHLGRHLLFRMIAYRRKRHDASTVIVFAPCKLHDEASRCRPNLNCVRS